VNEGRAYIIKSPGILVCGDLATGEVIWQVRLKGPFWGTPVLAGDRIFAVNQEGLVQAVDLGDKKGTAATKAEYGEIVLASPIVVDGALFIRGERTLTKIAK
jgi:outer membrane protein assembly factor BamB